MTEVNRIIWRRRVMLMPLIALLVAIPVTIAVRDGEGDPERTEAIEAPDLGAVEFNRKLGVELRLPGDWRSKTADGQLQLTSADRAARIGISAPAGRGSADGLHDATLAQLRSDYKRVEILRRVKRSEVGALPARTTALAARQPGKRGAGVRILLNTAKGEKRAYLVIVFAAAPNPGEAIVEAQAVLNDIRLVG